MSITRTIITGVVGVLIGVALMLLINSGSSSSPKVGAVSGMLVENYDPYFRNNGGYNSALPIKTSSSVTSGSISSGVITGSSLVSTGGITAGAGATINGGNITVTTSNTATSSIIVGCIQFYATSTATALRFLASTTPGVMYSQYGSCPATS